jgi:mono/diheme cytochrome c family protein
VTRGAASLALLLALALAACSRPASPKEDPVPAVIAASGAAYQSPSSAEGRRVYLAYCATCHGEDGRGNGQNASRLSPRPPDLTRSLARLSPADIRRIVEGGTASVGRTPLCPPHGRTLGPERVNALLAFLAGRGLVGKGS